MNFQELQEKLQQYSPFRFQGTNYNIVFKKDGIYSGDKLLGAYKIEDGNDGTYKILRPDNMGWFAENFIIVIPQIQDFRAVINLNEYKLIHNDLFRNVHAPQGFFTLESIKK